MKLSLLNIIFEQYESDQRGVYKDIGQYITVPYSSYKLPTVPTATTSGGVSSGVSEFVDTPIVPVEALTTHLINYIQSAIKNVSSQTSPEAPHYIAPDLLANLKGIISELKEFKSKLRTDFKRQFEFPEQPGKRIFIPSSVYYKETDKRTITVFRPMVPIASIIDYLIGSIKAVLKNSKTYSRLREKDIDYVSPSQLSNFRRIVKELEYLSEELRYSFPEQFKLSTHQSAKQFLKK